MRRFIITGAPGAGKTAILRQLELDGFRVVACLTRESALYELDDAFQRETLPATMGRF